MSPVNMSPASHMSPSQRQDSPQPNIHEAPAARYGSKQNPSPTSVPKTAKSNVAMEKEKEEHEAQKFDDEELPKSSMKHLQRGMDQQASKKGEEEHEANKYDDEEPPKSSMKHPEQGMDQEARASSSEI